MLGRTEREQEGEGASLAPCEIIFETKVRGVLVTDHYGDSHILVRERGSVLNTTIQGRGRLYLITSFDAFHFLGLQKTRTGDRLVTVTLKKGIEIYDT